MTPDRAAQRSAIERALLEFHRTPGKYPLIRRQPSLLFASVKDVLQIASGRAPDADDIVAPAAHVQKAAGFFIRSALLYPDADHYALLGLDASTDAAAIKERYRQMMRLMHPDFADAPSGADWPADAATRVNQAYDILSSPSRRRAYDDARDPPAAPAAPPSRPETRGPFRTNVVRPPSIDPRYRLKQLAVVFGVTGSVALAAALYIGGTSEKESLVQRSHEIDVMVTAALPQETPTSEAATPNAPATATGETESVAETTSLPQPLAAPAVSASVAPPQLVPAPAPPPVLAAMPEPRPIALAASTSKPVIATLAPAVAAPAPTPVTIAAAPAPEPATVPPTVIAIAATPSPAATSLPPVPSPPAGPARPNAGVTMAEVHPLLSKLLQQMESGWGDQVLSVLEREARAAPAAQALARNYNALLDGGHRVRLSNVQFKSEPREGRLLVVGHVSMLVGEPVPGAAPKQFSLQAEFASRDGSVVMTRLAQVDN
jgi:DnaJ-domain-containing protein 1